MTRIVDDSFTEEDEERTQNNDLPEEEVSRMNGKRFSIVFRLVWLAVLVLGYTLFQIREMLAIIITGMVLSLAIERFISFRQHLGTSRGFALWFAYFILILFVLSGFMILVPFMVTQLISLWQLAIDGISTFQTHLQQSGIEWLITQSNLPDFLKERLISHTDVGTIQALQLSLTENISQFISVGGNSLKSAGTFAFSLFSGISSGIFRIVMVLTTAVFFSVEREAVIRFFASLGDRPRRIEQKITQLSTKLWLRLEGQLLLCFIIGTLVGLGLWILSRIGIDLPNKFSLALIAGITECIPYIGPILGGIPALLVAFLAFGWKWLLGVIILYRLIQALENNFIVPVVMSKKLGINPLVIFLCMIIGASIFGFLGVLLAVPSAVIVSMLFANRHKL